MLLLLSITGTEKKEIENKITYCIRAMEGTGELNGLICKAATLPDEQPVNLEGTNAEGN